MKVRKVGRETYTVEIPNVRNIILDIENSCSTEYLVSHDVILCARVRKSSRLLETSIGRETIYTYVDPRAINLGAAQSRMRNAFLGFKDTLEFKRAIKEDSSELILRELNNE
jgi:hypothetical protein